VGRGGWGRTMCQDSRDRREMSGTKEISPSSLSYGGYGFSILIVYSSLPVCFIFFLSFNDILTVCSYMLFLYSCFMFFSQKKLKACWKRLHFFHFAKGAWETQNLVYRAVTKRNSVQKPE
jgi:hypothetical protein